MARSTSLDLRIDSDQKQTTMPAKAASQFKLLPLFAFVNVVLFIIYSIVSLYYETTIIDLFIFQVPDPPWMPVEGLRETVMGVHHFGDLKIWFGYAAAENPYLPPVKHYAHAPALCTLLFRSLLEIAGGQIAGWTGAFSLYMLLQTAVLAVTVTRIRRAYFPDINTLAWLILIVTSPGVLAAIDRGGTHIIAACLAFNYFLDDPTDSKYRGAVMISLAVVLKPYFIVCIFFSIVFGRWREYLRQVLIVMVLIFAPFLLLSRPFASIEGWLTAMSYHEFGGRSLVKSVSFLAALDRVSIAGFLSNAFDGNFVNTGRAVAVAYSLMVIIIILRTRSHSLSVLLLMSCTSFLVPLSYWYVTAWIPIALPVILRVRIEPIISKVFRTGRDLFSSGLICQMIFIPLYGSTGAITTFSNPISQLLVLAGVIAMASYLVFDFLLPKTSGMT